MNRAHPKRTEAIVQAECSVKTLICPDIATIRGGLMDEYRLYGKVAGGIIRIDPLWGQRSRALSLVKMKVEGIRATAVRDGPVGRVAGNATELDKLSHTARYCIKHLAVVNLCHTGNPFVAKI